MTVTLTMPDRAGLHDAVQQLASWQRSGAPLQLHPGDIGWFWRLGADRAVAAVRTWRANGRLAAIGLLDGEDLLRVTVAPELRADAVIARAIAHDITAQERGVLPAGSASVELPTGAVLDDLLAQAGWERGEAWTPLERDLRGPVLLPAAARALRIVEVDGTDAALVSAWAAVQRSAFDTAASVDDRWYAMAAGVPFARARCLLGVDGDDAAAGIIAWSAGAGRPGVIEPMGVHADHRGRGHARTITLAAATALRALGASSVQVCTESDRVGAIAAYRSAGFVPMAERFDRVRRA